MFERFEKSDYFSRILHQIRYLYFLKKNSRLSSDTLNQFALKTLFLNVLRSVTIFVASCSKFAPLSDSWKTRF